MLEHWQGMNVPLHFDESDMNLHVDEQKSLAIFHLNQLLKCRLSQLMGKLSST